MLLVWRGDAQEEAEVTYMPADNLSNRQQQLDQKFHEYKLAALTGLMNGAHNAGFSQEHAERAAVIADLVARAMERMDLAESPRREDVAESGDAP